MTIKHIKCPKTVKCSGCEAKLYPGKDIVVTMVNSKVKGYFCGVACTGGA